MEKIKAFKDSIRTDQRLALISNIDAKNTTIYITTGTTNFFTEYSLRLKYSLRPYNMLNPAKIKALANAIHGRRN